MPCLNEADTIAACIEKAQRALVQSNIAGEIIVADNSSSDDSATIAALMGARVVYVERKGYGYALMAGITAARGQYIIMGDADDSYDFLEIPRFVAKLREGFDLVQGCRLPSGGGRILPGAMPFLHRCLGNPILSKMTQWMYRSPINDVYCGLRGFTKALSTELQQRCTGMEFATEMVVNASLRNKRIAEVAITLHRDGRKAHGSHVSSFRDGWRTLRLLLLYSPQALFLLPGAFLMLLGAGGYGIALPGASVHGVTFDAHTLLFASLFLLLGYQSILFGIFARTFAVSEGLLPEALWMKRFYQVVTLEKGLIGGAAACGIGAGLLGMAVLEWWRTNFGHLDYPHTMRLVIPGATLTALGFQTVLSSFLVSLLGIGRR